MSKIYLLFPRVLKGQEAEKWKASRRQIVVDTFKRSTLDGINPFYKATYGMEVLSNYDDPV